MEGCPQGGVVLCFFYHYVSNFITCKKSLYAVKCMAYKIKITAESNGTIVFGIIFKNLIPDFCIFYLPLCAESKRRFGFGCICGNV